VLKSLSLLLSGMLTASLTFSAHSQTAPAPSGFDWASLAAGAVKAYFASQEGKCVEHAASCTPDNVGGTAKRSHEVTRRIRVFMQTPSKYNADQVFAITGSDRTQCIARRLMCDARWDAFNAQRGR
jgi:hypothetical protein